MSRLEYQAEVKNLVRMVHRCNPAAQIVWAYGLMGTHMEEELLPALDELKAEGIEVPYIRLPENWDGGDAHPSKEGHAKAAKVLTEELRRIMQWG